MYVVYNYNSFIFNLFFACLLLLTFIYVLIMFLLVRGHLCGRIEELYMSGMTSLTSSSAKSGKAVSLDIVCRNTC